VCVCVCVFVLFFYILFYALYVCTTLPVVANKLHQMFIFFTKITSIDMHKSTLNYYIDKVHHAVIFVIAQLSCSVIVFGQFLNFFLLFAYRQNTGPITYSENVSKCCAVSFCRLSNRNSTPCLRKKTVPVLFF